MGSKTRMTLLYIIFCNGPGYVRLSTQHHRFRFIKNKSVEAILDRVTKAIQIHWGYISLIDSVGRYSWVITFTHRFILFFIKTLGNNQELRGNTTTPLSYLLYLEFAVNSSMSVMSSDFSRLVPDLFIPKPRLERKRQQQGIPPNYLSKELLSSLNLTPNHNWEVKKKTSSFSHHRRVSTNRRGNKTIAPQSIPVNHSDRNSIFKKPIEDTRIHTPCPK